MAPPTETLNLDVEAISGICGSISIACWVVVFSPQIVENFRRRSAEGLSIQFVVIWLLGDVFNILGAVLQRVLPTMLILAIYYTIADIVLLAQCFYYRGFTLRDDVLPPSQPSAPTSTPSTPPKPKRNGSQPGSPPDERTALLTPSVDRAPTPHPEPSPYHDLDDHERRGSWTHLSPAVPFVNEDFSVTPPPPPSTWTQALALNSLAILMVCAAGVAGWWLSHARHRVPSSPQAPPEHLRLDPLGQLFGWLCAALYLGSRLPQLLLNWRRKSTEGVSVLFFLFACLGNLTYVLSILAFDPVCAGEDGKCEQGEALAIYWQYVLVNMSWLAGSAGTLLLDGAIFVQFFLYSKAEEDLGDECSSEGESSDEEPCVVGGCDGGRRRQGLETVDE
ncbi:PQ loop repeat-domain-containing protein [Staphylotrichum tortipilum]|uniref:PQ loop repeat-domain-containing protein n=1 Tax=Staphylotrichum tortipilum TaxID=2831512 RepID=A0AAN6RST4_9PEZI|nr:PQ loop repeat-domain-containing protein [Staphylotrichum longicolle]